MSLARSASGPAGLTINTGAANSLTTPSQPAASGGLFGSGAANTTTTGGMFGNTQQKPATGLFGQPAAGTTSTPAAGGLFGNTNTQAQSTTGGSLFGNTATNTTAQPATGGGLFGNTASNTTAQPATGGGLFGNTATKPATGGLFGNTATQQTQQPATGTSLFGQSTAQSQPAQQTGGLFGASTTTNTQPATGGGLFGQSQAKPAGSLFGQTQTQQNTAPTLGQSTNNPVSAVQINWDSIRPRTRFDDLAKPVQDEIALLDKGIQRVIKMKDEIGEFMPQHERDIEQLGRDVKFVESKFKVVQVALNNDIQTVKVLQDMTKKNIADAQLSFKATDNLKLPTHYHQTGLFASTSPSNDGNGADAASTHANAQDLITYFNRICDDIEKYKKRLDDYRSDIERDMPGVENGLYEQIRALRERGSGSVVVQDKLGEVLAALRDTGNAIIAQAGQIAETRERLSRLQAGILDSGAYALGMAA